MSYIKPENVHSPKASWKLMDIIIDGGASQAAYAIGTWDGERRIGFRWNGSSENPIGNPQSRGLPTWTMLAKELHSAVVALAPPEKQAIIGAYFDLPTKIDLVVDKHHSGRLTLKEREGGRGMYKDLQGKLFCNNDEVQFYRAVCQEISERITNGQHVIFRDTYT